MGVAIMTEIVDYSSDNKDKQIYWKEAVPGRFYKPCRHNESQIVKCVQIYPTYGDSYVGFVTPDNAVIIEIKGYLIPLKIDEVWYYYGEDNGRET